MNATQETNSNSLVPVSQIGIEKLKTLQAETGGFKTWVRTNKDGSQFFMNGEPLGCKEIIGVLVDFAPNWTRWPEKAERPEKLYQDEQPEGDGWRRRCDLEMLTKQYGIVVLDLPNSAFRNFGKFTRDLKIYGKSPSDVFTRAIIGKGKSKKFGVFNTIRFEIAGSLNDGNNENALTTLPAETEVIDDDPAKDAPPAPSDEDFIPY